MNNIKRQRGRPRKNPIIIIEEKKDDSSSEEKEEDDEIGSIVSDVTTIGDIEQDDFLNDLNNMNFSCVDPKEEKEKEKQLKESQKENERFLKAREREEKRLEKLMERENKKTSTKRKPKSQGQDDDLLFSENGSEILGREKRELISKLSQYKSLFPEELKKFKVKKNATPPELQQYLDEMETIVNTSSVEQFVTDSILHCIKITEQVSTYTRFNVQGLSDILNQNPQFHQLSKMLYIKYKIFSAMPIEMQMLMLISTSAYICKCKNDKSAKYEDVLNEPVNNNI
jgi:hypothetical protein